MMNGIQKILCSHVGGIHKIFLVGACVAGLISTGCGAAGDTGSSEGSAAPVAPPAEQGEIHLLATVDIEAKHSVSFYELGDGKIALYETADLGQNPVGVEQFRSLQLVDQYRALAGTSAEVPFALSEAQARLSHRVVPAVDTLPPALADASVGNERRTNGAPALHVQAFGDPGDGDWWTQNFCASQDVDAVYCPVTYDWVNSGWRPTLYYQAAGMAQDSVQGASMYVDYWQSGAWQRVYNPTIAPRAWGRWTMETVGWFRSGVSGYHVYFSERYRNATPAFSALGDWPNGHGAGWTNDIQGVAHDATSWYFTNTNHIWKRGAGEDLNGSPSPYYSNPWSATWSHMGDLVYANGKIYVPLEKNGGSATHSGFGVFNTALQYYGAAALPALPAASPIEQQCSDCCPWVAYNPRDGLFYSSSFGPNFLYKYTISVNPVTITLVGSVRLQDGNGNPITLNSIQGGEFSDSGKLYLVSGSGDGGGGIRVVDVNNGRVQTQISFPFNPSYPSLDEPEGITIWNTSAVPGAYNVGQVHVLLNDNDLTNNDDLYFKHWSLDYSLL
jgi:hypothetical protein